MTYINPVWYILIPLALLQLIFAFYVYHNSKKYNLNSITWTLIVLFVPNFMGIIIYLVVRNQHKEKSEKKVCSSCGQLINKGDHYCSHCGVDQTTSCSSCHYPIHENWNYCPNCSHQL